ncbi:MAG TPA: ArsR family transcriptional regulator [Leucothrix sp.]|nr:ArsR family transcriptional regulator [Leucothrix sp.]
MEVEIAANALKELGHPTRLMIFKILVKAGFSGLPVGDLQKKLEIPNSTLSHHISKLVSVDLVMQRREGRVLYCIPQYENLNNLLAFLSDECCMDEDAECFTNKKEV